LDTVRVGLIGLGEMGKTHFSNCLHLKDGKLVAVSDVSEKALLLAKKFGIKHVYKDYNQLLENKDVDAVVISLPTFLHGEAAIKAAEHGKHMLVEKPLARNADEAEQIVSSAKSANVKLMVGYPLRFSPSFVDLRRKFELGMLGDVQIAIASFISLGPFSPRGENAVPKPVPSWWFDRKLTGGGALLDLGCHLINLLRWYFGEVTSFRSHLGYRFNMDFEDHAVCNLHFKNGVVAIANVGWFARYHKVRVDLFGTVGHGVASSKVLRIFDYVKTMIAVDKSTGFYRELEYFANCIRTDTHPTTSGEDGLQDIRIISEAYKNSECGKHVAGE
jgi:myo-inositol 2-dehydrogenase/D-chiro-inositol 1-dehydrogenase